MYKSPIQILRVIAILVMVLVTSSCTSEMKKSRYLARAERYFKAGEYDQAKIEYLKVLRIDSANAVAYARCGAMWADEGVPLRAVAFLLKARELAPEDVDNRYKLALVYLRVGQANEVFKEATEILKQAPGNGPALAILAETSVSPEQSQTAEQELQKFPQHDNPYFEVANGALAIRKGDMAQPEKKYDEVAILLQNVFSRDPDNIEGRVVQAQALLGKGDLKQGTELLERADKSVENNPLIKYQLALAYLQGKNTTQAINELEQAITLAPKYVEAIVLLAQLRLRAGDPRSVIT